MRALLQRVSQASVRVEDKVCGQIERGLLIFLGVGEGDTAAQADWLADKICGLRIFEDSQEKMNHSLMDVGGQALVVSQFTLFGDCRKGRRPSFSKAARPEEANCLYEYFVGKLRSQLSHVATGVFQAHMEVALVNDGPVTLWLDTSGNETNPSSAGS